MNRILREQALNETRRKMDLNAQRLNSSNPDITEENSQNTNSSTFIVAQTPFQRRERRYFYKKMKIFLYLFDLRSLFVPNTQRPPSSPQNLNETLTTVIPETPPNMINLPQSTRIESESFKLNISDLNLTDTQEPER